MRTSLDRASFHIVTAARVLSLELEQWQARPVGHISDQAGHTVSFDGWVALSPRSRGFAAVRRIG